MIVTQYPYEGDYLRIRTYSDEGFKIRKFVGEDPTDEIYDEAIDLYPLGEVNYRETEEKIETPEEPEEPEEPEATETENSDETGTDRLQ